MRRAPILAIAVLCMSALPGGAALAQTAASGPRALTWASRTAAVAPLSATATDARRTNRVIPHGGLSTTAPAPQSAPPRRTLTPATAWLRPPTPVPASAPVVETPVTPVPAMPPARPMPDYLPDQGGQTAPAEAVLAPAPAAEFANDPMAPRRDAPIFRLQRPGPAPTAPDVAPVAKPADAPVADRPAAPRVATVVANPADHPAPQGARYYSVHRQAGREPDRLTLPQPTYVDALAVTMAETPSSQDLAQPTEPPAMFRDAQGRLRATAAASDGDHQ